MSVRAISMIVGLALVSAVVYGSWRLNRWFNYEFGYDAQVKEAVCDIVRPEALITPCE